jgi:L-ascorbate metabolism protein UlaG (beta-lactamase superfamily)
LHKYLINNKNNCKNLMTNIYKRLKNEDLPVIKSGWEGNLFMGKEFSNSTNREKPLLADILKWQLSKNPQKEEKKREEYQVSTRKDKAFLSEAKDHVTWLGHSSFFIRIAGISLVIDPILYDLPLMKRKVAPPCEPGDIQTLDYILLTHNHRDHADKKTLKALLSVNPDIEALLPLRMGEWYKKLSSEFQEAGWWQKYNTPDDIEIYFLPAKHWCRRGMTDYNRMLWGSFMIRGNGKTIYYAGDTGWWHHFAEIRDLFTDIDYALLPIGAYMPQHIMKPEHMTPDEAVMASNALNSKCMIPMHYGTFDLSDEPLGEPIKLLKANTRLKAELKIPDVGEVVLV